jgi:hypothetical protein
VKPSRCNSPWRVAGRCRGGDWGGVEGGELYQTVRVGAHGGGDATLAIGIESWGACRSMEAGRPMVEVRRGGCRSREAGRLAEQ